MTDDIIHQQEESPPCQEEAGRQTSTEGKLPHQDIKVSVPPALAVLLQGRLQDTDLRTTVDHLGDQGHHLQDIGLRFLQEDSLPDVLPHHHITLNIAASLQEDLFTENPPHQGDSLQGGGLQTKFQEGILREDILREGTHLEDILQEQIIQKNILLRGRSKEDTLRGNTCYRVFLQEELLPIDSLQEDDLHERSPREDIHPGWVLLIGNRQDQVPIPILQLGEVDLQDLIKDHKAIDHFLPKTLIQGNKVL